MVRLEDGWSRGWLAYGDQKPTRLRRQQGGEGVMFWAGILDVKMSAATYEDFLK